MDRDLQTHKSTLKWANYFLFHIFMLKFFSNSRYKVAATAFFAAVLFFSNNAPVLAQYYDDYYGSSADGAAFGAFALVYGLFWCCVALVGVIMHFGVTYYIYKDAEQKGINSPILWAILYFFFQSIALLIYFYINRDWKTGKHTPSKIEESVNKAAKQVKEKVEEATDKLKDSDKK